ncbi:MAG: winged helix-turn-helix domain-containing protein [Pseudooceanicola sp.]|nr:winged helix-turn-helix domain-containing protein [Pseudooceanicola sp.]
MALQFEDFELDSERAELRRGGGRVHVEPQVFDLLSLLVTSNGRLVSRDEIFECIWGERIVSDAALSSRIRDARKALGDDGSVQRLIQTVPRRGLRFLGEVSEAAAGLALESGSGADLAAPVAETPRPDILREPEATRAPAIAVLPLSDLSSETGRSPLADAVTEEIEAALCAWRHFSVVARNSAYRFRGSDAPAGEIGQTLGARYLLGGSLRRTGSRIKLNIVLTDTERDHQIWVERFARDLSGLVDVEEEIASQVVTALVPEIESAEARRVLRNRTESPSAWEHAMLAAWQTTRGAEADYEAAERHAALAADIAPDWYLPCSLIAFCHFQRAMEGFSASDSRTAFSQTLKAARQALDVDRNSWIAQALAAVGELWTSRNHDRALTHIHRAIDLNASAPQLYHFAGCITGFSGDPKAAIALQQRLFRMDPVYTYAAVIEADLGLWHLLEQDFDEADRWLARAEQTNPRYGRALQRRVALAGLTGDRAMAIDAARRMSDLGLVLDRDIIADSYPFREAGHRDLFMTGLQRSGINF